MNRRRLVRLSFGVLLLLPGASFAVAQEAGLDERRGLEGCTIGVAAGRATMDGRPLLWKTRDADAVHNEVRWAAGVPFSFLGVFNAEGTSPWMAVNERGLAVVNANSLDLPGTGSSGNGVFMRRAMTECGTVADFRQLLESTNETGRRTQAHFAVLDTTGAAALFETGGFQYWEYDAGDSCVPAGFLVRTNFAVNGGGSSGLIRYRRSQVILDALRSADSLCVRTIIARQMRDFADAAGNPFPVPYPYRSAAGLPFGYIPTGTSICGISSVSAAVVRGVLPGEPAMLTTMWTLLGFPATAVAVPYWPAGPAPAAADGDPGAPLCDEARRLLGGLCPYDGGSSGGSAQEFIDSYALRDGMGGGIWERLLPAEDRIARLAEESLERWRTGGVPPPAGEMLAREDELATDAWETLRALRPAHEDAPAEVPPQSGLAQNYPNPFNATTRIRFSLAVRTHARVELFDVLGRNTATLFEADCPPGTYEVNLEADDLAGGVYWYRLTAGDFIASRTLVLLK